MKNKVIALSILAVVILVPFRFAYTAIDITSPALTLIAFLATLGGSLAALFVALK